MSGTKIAYGLNKNRGGWPSSDYEVEEMADEYDFKFIQGEAST